VCYAIQQNMSLNGYNDSLLEQEKIAKSEYGRSFLA
jgi:hypothetical protein